MTAGAYGSGVHSLPSRSMLTCMRRTLGICLVMYGCTPSATHYDVPFEPPPAGATGTLPQDPVRDALREILIPCQRSLGALDEQRIKRNRRRAVMSALASIISVGANTLANEQGGGNSASGAVWRPSRCTGANASHPECTSLGGGAIIGGTADTLADDGQEGPARVSADTVRDALSAIDDLLWSEPDSRDWEQSDWTEWDRIRVELDRACGAIDEALND